MIERYARKDMQAIWSDENRFASYLKVELLVIDGWSALGVIPADEARAIHEKATFTVKRIREIELETKHDVIAFTRCVSESLGDEKKWVHYGLTSTDVVDTAQGFQLKQANDIIAKDLDEFMAVLASSARAYEKVPCIGRTHGMHADITSFGLKWANWHAEMARNRERFTLARAQVEAGKISGAVGTFSTVPPAIQDHVCEALGLASAPVSTQTLQRDRHAFYISTLALIASSLEAIATEIRNLQRTEIHEVEEPFAAGQKGSSAMPHKRNPITSENICGCARLMRSYITPAYEDIALWGERDISHSSVERVMLPDATELLDYMLARYTKTLAHLVVYPDRMLENIALTHGVIFAQRVMNALIEHGASREAAYDHVQVLSMASLESGTDFAVLCRKDDVISSALSVEALASCFTFAPDLSHVHEIYERCGLVK